MAFKLPFRISTTTLAGVGAVAALSLMGVLSSDGSAQAQVAAKVESQSRPNFGILLDPPTRSSGARRHHRRWNYRDHNRWGPGHRPPPPLYGTEEVVLIDCGGNPGSGALESAVARVRPGGMLVIRARGGACVGWLNIDKPMTIVGDGRFDRAGWGQNPAATIQAPDGLPCMTVAQGVRVEVRDVVFESRNAGEAACVVGYGATLLFHNVGMRHAGDEAAIYVDGGALDIRDSVIDSQSIAPAVVADGAVVTAYETEILRAQSGMELTPGAGQTSTLTRVSMRGVDSPNNFGPRAIGLLVRSGRDYGRVEVSNSRICGYVEGVAVEGASVEVRDSRICRVDKGAVLYNGELLLTDSRVRAETLGVAAASGRAVITSNIFSGIRQVVFAEQRASVEERDNRVYSRNDLCRPQFRPRYRDRYEPQFGGNNAWRCEYSPYPQNWWAEEEGWLGLPYYNDAYALDGYDRYQSGYGWYDQGGRYVDDNRWQGDHRWGGRFR
jgi:hypothetical protein